MIARFDGYNRQAIIQEARDLYIPWRRPRERGPNGHLLCRLCGKEVPKGRRTLCSPKCAHAIIFWTGDPRYPLWVDMDGVYTPPVCARCGRNAVELHHILPLYLYGAAAHHPDCVAWLCGCCHNQAHRSGGIDLPPGVREKAEARVAATRARMAESAT